MTFCDQTGYSRPNPFSICQDHDVLLKVKSFTYDINNDEFIKYFENRSGVMITKCNCGLKIMKKILDKDIEPPERYHDIIKRRLEDCWEIYEDIRKA